MDKQINLLNKNTKFCKLFIKGEGYIYSFDFSASNVYVCNIRFVDNKDMAYKFINFNIAYKFVCFLTKMFPNYLNKCEVV